MDLTQLQAALDRRFNEDPLFNGRSARLVFWNDPEREFQDSLPDLVLEGVKILNLDEIPALKLKILLEQEDPEGRYLLYSPHE
ncbi:MAG: hypothetical protein GY856_04090, partial [bacterium]|nr:hypothetical protein [bacterium]